MSETNKQQKSKTVFLSILLVIVAVIAGLLYYSNYAQFNFSKIDYFTEEEIWEQPLPVLADFEVSDLADKSFYELNKQERLEYNEQAKGVSTSAENPMEPTDISVVDTKTGNALIIFWQQSNMAEYQGVSIYRSDSEKGTMEKIAEELPVTGNFQDTGLTNNATYYYEVRSVSEENESNSNKVYSGVPTDKIAPTSPTNIEITNIINESGKLEITWENPVDQDLDHIRIYRSEKLGELDSDDEYTKILNGAETFIDEDIKDYITYYYVLTAVDANGNESNRDLLLSTQGNPDPFNFESYKNINS